jgi:hypothetical protein
MSKDCLDAIYQMSNHIGQLQGILIAEGINQSVESPDSWMAPDVALPKDAVLQDDFDTISEYLALSVPDIASACMDRYPEFASVKQMTANGMVEDFQNPFAGETGSLEIVEESDASATVRPGTITPRPGGRATDAYQLWNQLNAVQGAIMEWVKELLLEPSRHAKVLR